MMRAHTIAAPIRSVLPAAALLMVLGACGGDDAGGVGNGDQDPVRACSPEPPDSSGWAGPRNGFDGLGEFDVERFNSFLAEAEPPISTSPCDAARVFDHLDIEEQEGVTVDLVVDPEDSAQATVTITRSNFADDSVFGSRWVLEFEPAEGERIRLVRAIASQRCQPGRGQQDFEPRLCI